MKTTRGETLLDEVLPEADVSEVHEIRVAAGPERVFAAAKEVTPAEVPVFRWLMAARALPARLLRRAPAFTPDRPILEQFRAMGFQLLGERPPHEMVVGGVGQYWRFDGGIRRVTDLRAFVDFGEPGFLKAAVIFRAEPADGGTRLVTETRVKATDAAARRKFARYWRLIGRGSAAIRRSWLKAIKARAER